MHCSKPLILALVAATTAQPALAADLQGHSARYRLNQASNSPKTLSVTGSLSIELRLTCHGYETSWSASYGFTDGKAAGKQYEETLSTREARDASSMEYSSRFRINAHTTAADGQVRFGKDDAAGTIAVRPSGLAPNSAIQPKTLPPVALRRKIVDAMLAGERGPWIVQGMEMVRFHRSNDLRIEPASGAVEAPTPAGSPGAAQPLPQPKASGMPQAGPPPKGVKYPDPADREGLMKAKSATLKQSSYQVVEFANLFMQLHTNGLISKLAFRRDGYDIVGSLVEVNAFATPSCN